MLILLFINIIDIKIVLFVIVFLSWFKLIVFVLLIFRYVILKFFCFNCLKICNIEWCLIFDVIMWLFNCLFVFIMFLIVVLFDFVVLFVNIILCVFVLSNCVIWCFDLFKYLCVFFFLVCIDDGLL